MTVIGQTISDLTAKDTAQAIASAGTHNGASIDAGAAPGQAIEAVWELTTTGTAPNCNVYAQHSEDNSNWSQAVLICNVGTTNVTRKSWRVPFVLRYQRLYYSNAGANSITITSKAATVHLSTQ